jgi:endonuclease III
MKPAGRKNRKCTLSYVPNCLSLTNVRNNFIEDDDQIIYERIFYNISHHLTELLPAAGVGHKKVSVFISLSSYRSSVIGVFLTCQKVQPLLS